jgi:hypothetical protein
LSFLKFSRMKFYFQELCLLNFIGCCHQSSHWRW